MQRARIFTAWEEADGALRSRVLADLGVAWADPRVRLGAKGDS